MTTPSRRRADAGDAPTDPSLKARLRALHADLPAAEKRLADAVLVHHDALLGYTATELAALAGVSKASAARFFRRLGFADFQAFRGAVRAEAAAAAPLHRMPARGGSDGAGRGWSARLAAHASDDQHALGRLPALVAGPTLAAAVARLSRARCVWVIGYRNAHSVAVYAQSLLQQVRPGVALLSDEAGRETERLADVRSGDVLLAVDLRRRTRRLSAVVRAGRDAGAGLVLLTDAPMSPLEADADAVLRCPTHDARLFDSYVAPISLANFLAAEVAARSAAAARARLARIESLHQSLADLDAGGDAINR